MKSRKGHHNLAWSKEEEDILREFYPKEGPKGIAPRLPKRSGIAINVRAHMLGIRFENETRFTTEEVTFIRDHYLDMGPTKIGRALGRTYDSIAAKAVRMGLKTKIRKGSDHMAYRGYQDISGAVWTRIKRSAREREMSFDITIEYIWELYQQQMGRCKLSCLPLKFPSYSEAPDGTASLDRIDSTKGYVKGNVQWVHKDINMMKQDWDDASFIALCKAVAKCNS